VNADFIFKAPRSEQQKNVLNETPLTERCDWRGTPVTALTVAQAAERLGFRAEYPAADSSRLNAGHCGQFASAPHSRSERGLERATIPRAPGRRTRRVLFKVRPVGQVQGHNTRHSAAIHAALQLHFGEHSQAFPHWQSLVLG
jgi:hypothetical protein